MAPWPAPLGGPRPQGANAEAMTGEAEEAPSAMRCRGIRGATTVDSNAREEILEAASELLSEIVRANDVAADDVASVIFTTTPDLNAEFPALAARQMGWNDVALLCGHEMNVPGSLPMCLRILLHVNTEKRAEEIVHVYLKGARVLRPEFQRRPD
jgi:chorismate mutase